MRLCKSCHSSKISRIEVRQDLAYWRCIGCGHCSIDLIFGMEVAFEEAQSLYFGSRSCLLQSTPNILDIEVFAERKQQASRWIPIASHVIEVGPGSGLFASLLKSRGDHVELVEHSPVLAAAIVKRLGIHVHVGEFENVLLPLASAEVFCSFHVIEHVKDPQKFLRKGLELVKPGGIGLVATPNASSWQQRLFERLSPNFDCAHLHVFSKTSLIRCAELAGWSVAAAITPAYTSSWVRVLTKSIRKLKAEDEELTAGKYATPSLIFRLLFNLATILSWPVRKLQAFFGGGNEILLVLRRPEARREDLMDLVKKVDKFSL
jgi:2-polyprenyl-3-methyl-5-hydroxy-6-metoxy-1,4-benzoquinol methylase